MVEYEAVVAMHLAFWYVVLVCHQYDVCKHYVVSVYGGLSESGYLSSVNCVQSAIVTLFITL